MDIASMVQLIGSLGFPIAMCLYLMKHMEKAEDRHNQEIGELRKVVEENTVALVKLCEKIDACEHSECLGGKCNV